MLMNYSITETDIINALRKVNDPELHKDLVSLGMVKDVSIDGTAIRVKIDLTTPACPLKDKIESDVREALIELDIRNEDITIEFGAQVRQTGKQSIEGVKHIIAIGSGKGGVGKSTVTANLAASLALEGAKVGLLDADIYGPSQAKMFQLEQKRLLADENKRILPQKSHGIKIISIANLVQEGQALIWRGPMLHGTLTQMLTQTLWGELDYLLIDLPPGTGDVQLSLSQLADITGAVLVTTPQDMALIDVKRSYAMFNKTHIPVLGVIENMSYYQLPDGTRDYIFGEGGAQAFAEQEKLALLGHIPLNKQVRQAGDTGMPLVLSYPDSLQAQAFREAARILAGQISIQAMMTLPMI